MKLQGFATTEATARYRDRYAGAGHVATDPPATQWRASRLHENHFRQRQGLWFSSLGIGSYLGESDEPTDRLYEEALKEAVLSGVNVMDSAINYRCQRSERSFGKALGQLISSGKVQREEIIVCTKGGFLPFDGSYPKDPAAYFEKTYVETGILNPDDMVQGCHAMTPKFLEDQLGRSLANLGLETVDIYYLHNPELQLEEVARKEFFLRMRKAFEWLETKVAEGRIRFYGTATWNGYRVPQESREYLSLEELSVLAREAAGPAHHFKAVQLPFNLAMPEAWVLANQPYGAHHVPFFGLAEKLDLIAIGSAALLQGRLTGPFPDFLEPHFKSLKKSSQRALQFARSVPGIAAALVGMKNKTHLQENLEVAKVPALTSGELHLMFQKAG